MSNQNINLRELFLKENKCCEVEVDTKIESFLPEGELLCIDVINENNLYKQLVLPKSEIHPEPSINSLIKIKKIYYKFDEDFHPRLFISAIFIEKLAKDSVDIKNENSKLNELNCSKINIRETLYRCLDIKKDLSSNIFLVKSINEKEYSLELFKRNKLFSLAIKNELLHYVLKEEDIIYITDYFLEEEVIKLTQISLIEKLSEEGLFVILEKNQKISKDYMWGKIIEKDRAKKKIRALDKNRNVITFQKYNEEIKLGQFFIFPNDNIAYNQNILQNNIEDSFDYYSSEELYFSNRLNLNMASVLEFYFIDFNEDQNYYSQIRVGDCTIEICEKCMYIVYNSSSFIKNKLIPTKIYLVKNILEQLDFSVIIFKGLLNKINVFINHYCAKPYYFEYLYIYFEKPKNILNKNKIIECFGKKYTITTLDNFDSYNRIRFNVLNIPMQQDCKINIKTNSNTSSKHSLSNSIFICEVFINENESNIYGIFDINDIMINKGFDSIYKNINYNEYYNELGWIYDYIKNNITEDDDKSIQFLTENKNLFQNFDALYLTNFFNIGIEITNSELKSRIGILICSYLKMDIEKKNFRKLITLRNIKKVIQKIESIKGKLKNSQILRIFSYLLKAKIVYHYETEIIFLSEEENDSAYLLAQNFVLKEIDNMNEFSKLFQGYLQMDSYVLYNHKIGEYSYSLSIEPIYVIKYHLKSNYEGFFVLEEVNDNILGWTEPRENITIINEKYLFENSKFKDPSHISDIAELNNCAFGITIVLRHENNCHKKKNLNNNLTHSPLFYCDNGVTIKITDNNPLIKDGEDGIIIESLITKDQSIIISLAKDFIYGELLDYQLFIQKDFSELLGKIEKICQNKENKNKISSYSIATDKSKNIAINTKNEMRNIQNDKQKEQENLDELAKDVIRKRVLKLGDVFYSLDLIKMMVISANKTGRTNQLSPIFYHVYDELNKIEKNSPK